MHLFGLIGYPLSHSFSKKYFTEKFQELGLLDYRYELLEMPDLSGLPALLQHSSLFGLNVTIPFKRAVVSYTDSLDENARATGVVNTLKFVRTDFTLKVHGFNTDVTGFRKALLPLLPPGLKEALVLGGGASARTASFVLEHEGIVVHVVSRTPAKGQLRYDELSSFLSRCLLVVNTTPVGMYPHSGSFPEIPYDLLTPQHILFDFIYNPAETLFLAKGREKGAQTENGLSMLRYQAEEAWSIWNDPAIPGDI